VLKYLIGHHVINAKPAWPASSIGAVCIDSPWNVFGSQPSMCCARPATGCIHSSHDRCPSSRPCARDHILRGALCRPMLLVDPQSYRNGMAYYGSAPICAYAQAATTMSCVYVFETQAVSSFVTLSFEPPLVMFAIQRNADSYPAMVQTKPLGLTLLRDPQAPLSPCVGPATHRAAGDDCLPMRTGPSNWRSRFYTGPAQSRPDASILTSAIRFRYITV
jgi:hypothetical protein